MQDWGCASTAPEVRLVRNVSSNARVRVMATNLDSVDFPWECFGELESVSGLSQHALIIDVAAKVLADNLASLLCRCAMDDDPDSAADQPAKRQCNRGYAAAAMLRRTTCRIIAGRSTPRPKNQAKPHARYAYK